MPKDAAIRDLARRKRNMQIGYCNIALDDLPNSLKKDSNGNTFLRYDSGVEDDKRFIILISECELELMKNVETILVDGTFYVSPHNFKQLVTIHAFLFGKTKPFIYTVKR